ncbi:hypothetical protein KEM56_000780 [Ascosphaera pollenicola]|nr:hypothetical protein KEM56_000780 [Ascosphaera pollenicola]
MNVALSIRQRHYLFGYTDHVYQVFAKKQKFEPDTVALKEGGLGHWIGNKNAKNVIIYFHGMWTMIHIIDQSVLTHLVIGGGYGSPATIGHFYHLWDIMNELNSAGKDVCVFFVTYGLSPMSTYPTQYIHGVGSLRYIVNETGRSPSNVALGGDSAGANMCLAILSHMNHPHPAIEPLELAEPLAAVFLIAPWVSFDLTKPSMTTNLKKDFVTPTCLKVWSDAFLDGKESDNYSEAIKAPAKWWEGIKTRELLIATGKEDVLLSGIEEFTEKLMSVCSNVSYFAADGEPHATPLIWRAAGVKEPCQQEKRVDVFLGEQF